jgi:hypothetical protein
MQTVFTFHLSSLTSSSLQGTSKKSKIPSIKFYIMKKVHTFVDLNLIPLHHWLLNKRLSHRPRLLRSFKYLTLIIRRPNSCCWYILWANFKNWHMCNRCVI